MPVVLLLRLIDVDTQIVRFFERKQLVGNIHAGNVDGCEVQPDVDRDPMLLLLFPLFSSLPTW